MFTVSRIPPAERQRSLKEAIETKGLVRIIEAHSGISAIVGATAHVIHSDGTKLEFDGLWESSLTDSATKGLPDASIVGMESRLHTINEIMNVTSKPIIVDGDTGGEAAQFQFLVQNLERIGVSAVIIEDKVYPKRNSLDSSASQTLESPEAFAQKIVAGKQAVLSDYFMIIARIESLIAGTGLQDALIRAEEYIKAGVDGVMIHSRKKDPDDLFAFIEEYEKICCRLGRRPILVAVPTTYNHYSDEDLATRGVNVVIHANHLLRSAHRAMKSVAEGILKSGRSKEVEPLCTPVAEISTMVGLDQVNVLDRTLSKTLSLSVVIPAAGRDPIFPDTPKSLISIGGRPILEYQLESIRSSGIQKVVVVRGHEGRLFTGYLKGDENLTLVDNPAYEEAHSLYSLMMAQQFMQQGFVLLYSDILFEPGLLNKLLATGKDIVLAVDNSYTYHKHAEDKNLDLVVSRKTYGTGHRSLRSVRVNELLRIGKELDISEADFEFIGMAYFSARGARAFCEAYQNSLRRDSTKRFHEAVSVKKASVTDLLQEMIDQGYPVHGLEVRTGWMEIHKREDVEIAEREIAMSLAGV